MPVLSFVSSVLFLLLCLGGCSDPGASSSGGGETLSRLQGTVVSPLEGTYLYVYKKGMDLYGPAFTVAGPTGDDGGFDLQLPPGDYIVVARKRQNGENAGPVVAGDHRSEFIKLKIPGGSGQLTVMALVKTGDRRQLTPEAQITATGLAGRITDSDGQPVEGARVHVYDHVQMSERPKYVSEKTGPDGSYRISLPEGGTYYLAARDKFGGPPKLGDLYGRYDQGTIDPSAVVVREGEILKGVDITVTKVW